MKALRGVPDFFGVVNGRCVLLELKTEDGKASKLQLWRLRRWKQAGAFTAIVDPHNMKDILKELEGL